MPIPEKLFKKNRFSFCGQPGDMNSKKYIRRIADEKDYGDGYIVITTKDKMKVYGTPLGFFARIEDYRAACSGKSEGICVYRTAEQASAAEAKRRKHSELYSF
jgi:hypothetical protein